MSYLICDGHTVCLADASQCNCMIGSCQDTKHHTASPELMRVEKQDQAQD